MSSTRRSSSRARTSTKAAKPAPESPAAPAQARGRSRSRSASRTRASSRKPSTTRSSKSKTAKAAENDEPARVSQTPKRAIRTRSRSAVRAAASVITVEDDEEETVVKTTAETQETSSTLRRRSLRVSRAAGTADPAEVASFEATVAAATADAARPSLEVEPFQFGGPIGAFGVFVASHFLVFYFFACLNHNDGALILPTSFSVESTINWGKTLWNIISTHAKPTWFAFFSFWAFQIVQGLMAVTLPGVKIPGLPIPSQGGKRLMYNCNAVAAWYSTLAIMGALHYYGIFKLSAIVDNMGPFTTVALLSADFVAIVIHACAFIGGHAAANRTKSPFYDFFMGVWLNPRIGPLDLKMWAEVRVSWIMLFLITASAAMKQYETYGALAPSMGLILTAQLLYCNAIMKGEDCIPTTWDIFHENWGWMLIFWNLCGVPFVYTAQSMFLVRHAPNHVQYPTWVWVLLFVCLFVLYYVWDTANSQKNRLRMALNGSLVPRPFAFPQLPWGTLTNPKFLETKAGTPLLIDGWYAYARKFHYTVDIAMALIWALACGPTHFLPYFYVCFFTTFLSSRAIRDEQRCALKYGADWDRYTSIVKYRFIPGVY